MPDRCAGLGLLRGPGLVVGEDDQLGAVPRAELATARVPWVLTVDRLT